MQKSDLIKSKLSIVEFLENFCGTTVRKRGKNHMCKCPFHSDSKDSMVVNISDNNCFCFAGCNNRKPIDHFSGLMLLNGWTHKQAESYLLKELNINIRLDSTKMKKEIAKQKAIHKKMQQMKEIENHLLQMLLSREKKIKICMKEFIKTIEEAEEFYDLYHMRANVERDIEILLSDDTEHKYHVMKHYLGGFKKYENYFK